MRLVRLHDDLAEFIDLCTRPRVRSVIEWAPGPCGAGNFRVLLVQRTRDVVTVTL